MGALKTDSHKNHWATAVSEDVMWVIDMLLFAKLKQTGNPPWSWVSTLFGRHVLPGSYLPFSPASQGTDIPGWCARRTPVRSRLTSGWASWGGTCRDLWTAAASSLWRQSSGQLRARRQRRSLWGCSPNPGHVAEAQDRPHHSLSPGSTVNIIPDFQSSTGWPEETRHSLGLPLVHPPAPPDKRGHAGKSWPIGCQQEGHVAASRKLPQERCPWPISPLWPFPSSCSPGSDLGG